MDNCYKKLGAILCSCPRCQKKKEIYELSQKEREENILAKREQPPTDTV